MIIRVLAARPATAAFASAASTRTPATPAFAWNHGAGFIHHQCAPHQVAAVASFHRTVGSGVVIDFHEPEPTSLTGKTITHYVHAIDGDTRLRKEIR
jgi:hypothetical protein